MFFPRHGRVPEIGHRHFGNFLCITAIYLTSSRTPALLLSMHYLVVVIVIVAVCILSLFYLTSTSPSPHPLASTSTYLLLRCITALPLSSPICPFYVPLQTLQQLHLTNTSLQAEKVVRASAKVAPNAIARFSETTSKALPSPPSDVSPAVVASSVFLPVSTSPTLLFTPKYFSSL